MWKFFNNWWNSIKYEPDDPRYKNGQTLRVVVLGGGTGLANLLRGLKQYTKDITAIVSVADDGASSGKLRREYDVLPPGDIRKCLTALAVDEKLMDNLFEYRFKKSRSSLSNHTLGNIWLTALSSHYKSFAKAIEVTSELFKVTGKVLPSTLDKITLFSEYDDGKIEKGERKLDEISGKRIKRVFFKKSPKAYINAVRSIKEAELILIGPGSLYGSVIPNLLIDDISKTIRNNKGAIKIYLANCSTERTQTAGYSIEDHIRAIIGHSWENLFQYCIVNSKIVKKSERESVIGEINNITTTKKEIMGVKIFRNDVINTKNPLYHNSEKLAKAVIESYNIIKHRKN